MIRSASLITTKNPIRYLYRRFAVGPDSKVQQGWGDPARDGIGVR